MIKVHSCIPQTKNRYTRFLGVNILKILGWKVLGELPQEKKFIMAIAPHTSNWDFIIGVAVLFALNLRIKFLGKKSIFIWPFTIILTQIGGIPIDRSERHGLVGKMVRYFKENEYFILALSPEGTRSKTKEWKSGFLHIAHQANVPVVPISFDFRKKEVNFLPATFIDNNIEHELSRFKHFFDNVCAKKSASSINTINSTFIILHD